MRRAVQQNVGRVFEGAPFWLNVSAAIWGYKLGVIESSSNDCPTANVNRLSIDADICKRR